MNVRSSRVIVFAIVALAAISLGFTGAKILANETIGYVAGYTWFALMVIGVPLVLGLLVAGTILNFFSRTRWLGILVIVAAALIVASSFTSFKVLDVLGMVRYKHEEMIPLTPTVAQLVIFLKTGATHDEFESFWDETLSSKQGTGHWPHPEIRDLINHGAVDGHEVIVVGFFPNATDAERAKIKSLVASSPLVYKFVENVPYNEIDRLLQREPSSKAASNRSLDASGESMFRMKLL